ncbi:MAG: NAD(P)H-quinone oxidoreductase subunit 3 [Xanthomonadales bacterium]|nr:NAD(P)H-quinone oxidoreductase subunit 3 [Xanthomonadales bacterium]
MPPEIQSVDLTPLIIYVAAIVAVVSFMLGGSYVLGQRRRDRATEEQFESGIVPAGDTDTQIRFSVQYYLVAIFFVIFDLEAVFVFAWAIAFRESGWSGFIEMFIFTSVLVAGLIYLWLIGALDWRTKRQKKQENLVNKGVL